MIRIISKKSIHIFQQLQTRAVIFIKYNYYNIPSNYSLSFLLKTSLQPDCQQSNYPTSNYFLFVQKDPCKMPPTLTIWSLSTAFHWSTRFLGVNNILLIFGHITITWIDMVSFSSFNINTVLILRPPIFYLSSSWCLWPYHFTNSHFFYSWFSYLSNIFLPIFSWCYRHSIVQPLILNNILKFSKTSLEYGSL